MNSIIIILSLSILLAILILSQTPVQESLATAFHGEKVHTNKVENIIRIATWITASLIALLLILF